MTTAKEVLGKHFGDLFVVSFNRRTNQGHLMWNCICACGNIAVARGSRLINETTWHCGCRKNEHALKHGFAGTPIYGRWTAMRNRCYREKDPYYNRYGGRGITVCPEWNTSFEAFYKDMGPIPFKNAQLDRINNNGNYNKENCKWSTPKENRDNSLLVLGRYNATTRKYEEKT